MATAPRPEGSFHPLEIIPFFRRIPCSPARDLVYTFIWSTGLGTIFFAFDALGNWRRATLEVFWFYALISNVIGYVIHGLFYAGDRTGFEDAVKRAGFVAKVVYYSAVPLLGVFVGFAIIPALFGVNSGSWLARPEAVASIVITSVIISTILAVIFFWRERSAIAEAAVAREREQRERIEREAVLANLRALQAQIEPHFLFNTLANVTSLIDPDPAQAKRMLESFIRFLRASLANTRTESTTVGAEAELIAAYLDVLQVRMGARLRYRIDVADEVRGIAMPSMLLQPVVENAIRHGLEPKVEGGDIALSARRSGESIVIEISDSGVGFAPTTRGGVGLTNLRDRLRLLYGERAGLTVGETARGGATVTLTIPA